MIKHSHVSESIPLGLNYFILMVLKLFHPTTFFFFSLVVGPTELHRAVAIVSEYTGRQNCKGLPIL